MLKTPAHKKRRLAPALAALAAACCLLGQPAPAEAAALDPNVKMYTLETPHFRVNYPEGYDEIAQKAAQFAEEAHDKVSEYFGVQHKEKVEFTLFDHEDTVNGLALPYVSSAMYVYLTNPDSDLLWGRYDDWLKLVVTHEYTHILHFETVDGASKVINDVMGRVLFPNLFQPTFLIEGLAVITETEFAADGKGGRAVDGYFDMYHRADVLANRQLSIDQAGGYYLTDFPGGDSPYVYGTYFYKYLIKHYGADKPPKIAREYSKAPWFGIDKAVSQVIPGRDAQQIWDEMLHWVKRRAEGQIAEIRKRPVTQTTAVTASGMNHRHPGYLPNGNLTFIEGLRHGPTALYERVGTNADGTPALKKIMNKGHYGDYDVSPDGRYLYYHNSHGQNNYSSYDDIFRLDLKTGEKKALTYFLRANNPGISPDGKYLLGVINGRGLNNLRLFDSEGKFIKRLTDLKDSTQFTAPRWSPDGKQVVMSTWREASRDLFMLDTSDWSVRPLWKDDYVDVGPVWTPDSKYVIFASDRSNGVFNIFAWDWKAKELYQVTNVLTGAIEPAVSPDGKEIAVSMCTVNGFDIHTLPFDPSTWIKVDTPIFDKSIEPLDFKQKTTYPKRDYSPLPSLNPKFWSPIFLGANNVAGIFTVGYDVLLTNTVFGLAGYSVLQPSGVPDGSSFSPLDLSMHTFLYQNSQWDTNVTVASSGFANRSPIPLNNGSTLELWQRFDTNSVSLAWNNLPSPLTNASYQTGD
ncbi:MAG: TolB family protein, partial [Candidatus Sericytochromatia bacterium]